MCTLLSPALEHDAEQTVVICRAAVTLEKILFTNWFHGPQGDETCSVKGKGPRRPLIQLQLDVCVLSATLEWGARGGLLSEKQNCSIFEQAAVTCLFLSSLTEHK